MYRLILCEKPSVAQTVAYSLGANERVTDGKVSYYEGNGLIVTNAVGHIKQIIRGGAGKGGDHFAVVFARYNA